MKDFQKVDLERYDNTWYDPQRNGFVLMLWFVVNALFFINPINPFSCVKVSILRLFGAKMGRGVTIKPLVNIKYPWLLEVGDYSWIGERVWIDNLVKVEIGKNCCLSQGAFLLTGNHNYKKVTFDLMVGKVILEDGVWIGAGSIVGPQVTCKTHSVLNALSVASTDLEAYKVYRGNPATLIKERVIEK